MQDAKGRTQIDDRLDRIREQAYFGDARYLEEGLFELRWRSGRRVYYTIAEGGDGDMVIILLGGGKNGQSRDIAHARKLLGRETA